jgi:hypothetical protein
MMEENLTAILSDLRAAAGPDVPIVGMSYYDVFAPLCVSDPSLLFVCSRVDAINGSLVDTYREASDPVADVAGAFENDNLVNAAAHVCAWTWFCSYGDEHPNTAGYGVIAQAFEQVVQRPAGEGGRWRPPSPAKSTTCGASENSPCVLRKSPTTSEARQSKRWPLRSSAFRSIP